MTDRTPARILMDSNALVLAIVSKAESVPGRTSLQKLCYFANENLKAGIAFRPYFFGPYSDDIASSADVEVGAHLLREEVESGVYYRAGKESEWTRHTYSLTADGGKYLDWLGKQSKLPMDRIGEVVGKLKGETTLDPDALSILAKVRFVSNRIGIQNPEPLQVTKVSKTLGWSVPPFRARKALKDLGKLQL
jgi:uncharacterized protein YwgA